MLLVIEHKNPDIACIAIKLLSEISEDRQLDSGKKEALVKILDQNDFIRNTISRLLDADKETNTLLLEFLLVISEKSRYLS